MEGSQDLQHMEMVIEEENDEDFSARLFKSASYFPKTPTAMSQERLKEKGRQKGLAFTERVQELRQWLEAYSSWKNWRGEDLLDTGVVVPRSPTLAISKFVKSDLNVNELIQSIELHQKRAKTRLRGLQSLHSLLVSTKLGCVSHQLLCSLNPSLNNGHHFLDDIEACGWELTAAVTAEFGTVLNDLTSIARDSSRDLDSRLLALDVCGIRYHPADAPMLSQVGLLTALISIIGEKEDHLGPKPMDLENDDNNNNDSNDGQLKGEKAEDAEKDEPDNVLSSTAWTSFRLLSSQISLWRSEEDENAKNPGFVLSLKGSMVSLLSQELHRVGTLLDTDVDESRADTSSVRNHVVEVLSLFHLVTSTDFRSLIKPQLVQDLVGILKSKNAPPRAKRLAINLCQRILPMQPEKDVSSFVAFCFTEIGEWLMGHWKSLDEEGMKPMDIDLPEEEKKFIVQPVPVNQDITSYAVYLHSWPSSAARLFEECLNSVGPDFVSLVGEVSEESGETMIRKIVDEVYSKGKALLFHGGKEICLKVGKELTVLGAAVSVFQKEKSETDNELDERTKDQVFLFFFHFPFFHFSSENSTCNVGKWSS